MGKIKENNWHLIWNKKQLDPALAPTLEQLIALDGFDSPFSGINKTEFWLSYIESIATKLQITSNDSIFEVGCGAGAFLYPFYQQGNQVAGIDYSFNLVNISKKVIPQGNITVGEAIDIPLNNTFDCVISHGVFLYFPNYEYADIVLNKMLKIATRVIGIFDIPDLAKKAESIRRRKALMGAEEYEQKYKGLEHLYYSKDWFKQVLANEPVEVVIEDQNFTNYGNSQHRFNVLVYKK